MEFFQNSIFIKQFGESVATCLMAHRLRKLLHVSTIFSVLRPSRCARWPSSPKRTWLNIPPRHSGPPRSPRSHAPEPPKLTSAAPRCSRSAFGTAAPMSSPWIPALDVASDRGVIVFAAGEKQDQCEQYLCYFFHNITLELMSLYSNDCCILLFWKPYVPIWHTSTLLCRVWQCARNTAREQWDYSLLYHSGFRNSLYANDVTYSLGNLYWSVSSTGLSDQPWRAYSLESKR